MKVLIFGGGPIAAAKLEFFTQLKVPVKVISEAFSESILLQIQRQGIDYEIKTYSKDFSFSGYTFVVAATQNPEVNRSIVEDAQKFNCFANAVDQPEICDFIFPAIVQREDLVVAVSSSGISPVLARWIKQKIENMLPLNLSDLMHFLKQQKELVKTKLTFVQPRRLFWQNLFDSDFINLFLSQQRNKALTLFHEQLALQSNSDETNFHKIELINPNEDLSPEDVYHLSRADIIIYQAENTVQDLQSHYFESYKKIKNLIRKDAEKYEIQQTTKPCLLYPNKRVVFLESYKEY